MGAMNYTIKSPLVVDVSHWEGQIDWNSVIPRPWVVICKTSEGTAFVDHIFPQHWPQLRELGIRRGAYHYFHSDLDIGNQVQHYLNTVSSAGGFMDGDLPPILDLEGLRSSKVKGEGLAKLVLQWLEHAEREVGAAPIIYTSASEWSNLLDYSGKPPAWCQNYPLWVAWYPYEKDKYIEPPANVIPRGWDKWAMWQYAEDGRLAGILYDGVDLNITSDWYAKEIRLKAPIIVTPGVRYIGSVIISAGVRVRTYPDIQAAKITTLTVGTAVKGTEIKVVSEADSWLRIVEPVTGWCAIRYDGIQLIAVQELPPKPPPPVSELTTVVYEKIAIPIFPGAVQAKDEYLELVQSLETGVADTMNAEINTYKTNAPVDNVVAFYMETLKDWEEGDKSIDANGNVDLQWSKGLPHIFTLKIFPGEKYTLLLTIQVWAKSEKIPVFPKSTVEISGPLVEYAASMQKELQGSDPIDNIEFKTFRTKAVFEEIQAFYLAALKNWEQNEPTYSIEPNATMVSWNKGVQGFMLMHLPDGNNNGLILGQTWAK